MAGENNSINVEELPNQCLGINCSVRLPKGKHFCVPCNKRRLRGLGKTANGGHDKRVHRRSPKV